MRYLTKANTTMENISIEDITLPEVENLIHELYKPNPPEIINNIQELLQNLQKSPAGWRLADGLLSLPDDNVKFFGALTFTVKLNTETLSEENAVSVLQKLISSLIDFIKDGTAGFVVKKLCSTLVTYFIKYSYTWPNCIRHLAWCLESRTSAPVDDVKDTSPFEDVVRSMDVENFCVVTWFARFLPNEAEKVDVRSVHYIHFHERVVGNAADVAALLAHGISSVSDGGARPNDSISCLQAWLQYALRNPKQPMVQRFQELVHPVINCLPHDALYDTAVELLTYVLEDWPSFFLQDHVKALYSVFESDWGRDKYCLLLESEESDDEAFHFGLFMLAFGEAQMLDLLDPTDERAQRFLALLANLPSANGYPGVDNRTFVPAVEFWSTFAENLSDASIEPIIAQPTPEGRWDKPPVWQMMQAVSESSRKIQYPSVTVYNSWDSTERVAFADARKDVADFLQAVYMTIGKNLLSIFAKNLLEALPRSAWAELEAAAFCLGALSDCVSDETLYDDILTEIFGSPLFELLRQGQTVVPVRARQTCLSLIERYSDYFGNHVEYLPAALNLLFSAVGDRHLASSSSKSIYKLCSSCRSHLASEVDTFLEQYGSLRNGELDSLAEERVVGAIACIIQAVPGSAQKASAFRRLLTMIGMDVETSLQLSSCGEGTLLPPDNPVAIRAFDSAQPPTAPISASEIALNLAIRALRCLHTIAKGSQAPSEAPVDLDADDDGAQIATDADLNQVQLDIMNILVRLKETSSNSSEVVDAICGILRAGFSETEPGPFVFPPQMVTEFITSRWHNRIATVVNTASVFVTSLSSGSQKKYLGEVLGQLLPWVFGLLSQLSEPEQDPELSQYGIEFAQRIMAKRPDILLSQPANMLEFLFMFAIKLLNGSEPLPKAAAMEFWCTFISLDARDLRTRLIVEDAMSYLGPKLAEAIVQNIGGKASRSELDKFSEPLKKLVAQQVNARQWLEAALKDPAFPSDKVTAEDKDYFLKKVIMLRGQRATNQVVRDFWLSCRGSDFAYTS